MIRVQIEVGHQGGHVEIVEVDPFEPVNDDAAIRALEAATKRALTRSKAAIRGQS